MMHWLLVLAAGFYSGRTLTDPLVDFINEYHREGVGFRSWVYAVVEVTMVGMVIWYSVAAPALVRAVMESQQ